VTRGARKLAEQAQSHLADGERVEALHPVRNKGSIDAQAFGGAIGTVAGAHGSRAEREAASGIGVELGAFMAIAVTDRRLLLFSVTGVAKLDKLLSEMPLAEVESITVEKTMLGARKRITIAARGGSFQLEAPGRAKVEELTEAFEAAR